MHNLSIEWLILIFFVWNIIFGFKGRNYLYCGLVGFSGEGNASPDKLKILMLWNFFERGRDATGIYNPKQGLVKSAHDVRSYMKELSDIDDNLFIGHVRASTVGGNVTKNAHPFHIGNVIMAHNGTLIEFTALSKELGMKIRDWDVDSQILAYGLNKFSGFEVLNMFLGAAALLWVDKRRPGRLLAYRNKERPLYRGKREEGMYISSIEESLEAIGCDNIKEFTENNVYSINNGKVEFLSKTHPKVKPVVTYAQTSLGFSREELHWLDPTEFKDTWVKPFPMIAMSLGLPNDCWIYCVGEAEKNNKMMLGCVTEEGQWVSISKFNIDWDNYEIEPKDWVKVICEENIIFRGTQKVFCNNGDYLQVISAFQDGTFTLRNISNNTTANIERKYIRKADFREMETYFRKRAADRKAAEESVAEKRTVRLRENIKFTPKMMEYVNAVIEQIEDKIVELKDNIKDDNKELDEKLKDLLSFVDSKKFSIEETLAQD